MIAVMVGRRALQESHHVHQKDVTGYPSLINRVNKREREPLRPLELCDQMSDWGGYRDDRRSARHSAAR